MLLFMLVLQSCETMGEANNVCTDKTGTLTKNQMTVVEFWLDRKMVALFLQQTNQYNLHTRPESLCDEVPKESLDSIFEVLACNTNISDPNATEAALLHLMDSYNYPYKLVREQLLTNAEDYKHVLFTSNRKKSFTIFKKDGTDWLYTFGNVERILNCSNKLFTLEEDEVGLTDILREEILRDVKFANKKSLRTLGIARKRLTENDDPLDMISEELYKVEESGLTFLGFVGLKDPLRKHVREAVHIMTHAGITVRMVTGDSKETAISIARECGIIRNLTSGEVVMLGEEFNEFVGGLTLLCPKCEGKDQQGVYTITMEQHAHGKDEKKLCPKCREELQATAAKMDEFRKISKKLKVIASCRPSDKYLLVASLKFLQYLFHHSIEEMLWQ
eukprot:TRINITY_DN105024_c1_g1_i1.p1 TRINITY_DN105024_c1_g1~~TRINITY_DN105024_c1_g1_i1.p1  ORF type:complete len:389 (+),score=34.45 TRINITY_DN105024_c1_g1_i1:1443-2609(+)